MDSTAPRRVTQRHEPATFMRHFRFLDIWFFLFLCCSRKVTEYYQSVDFTSPRRVTQHTSQKHSCDISGFFTFGFFVCLFLHALFKKAYRILPIMVQEDPDSRFHRLVTSNPTLEHCIFFNVGTAYGIDDAKYRIRCLRVNWQSTRDGTATQDYVVHYKEAHHLIHLMMECYTDEYFDIYLPLLPKLEPQHSLAAHQFAPIRNFMLLHDFNPRENQDACLIVEFAEFNERNKRIRLTNFKKMYKNHPRVRHYDSFEDFFRHFPRPWKLEDPTLEPNTNSDEHEHISNKRKRPSSPQSNNKRSD